MIADALRRLARTLSTLLLVAVAAFTRMLGDAANPEQTAELKAQLGLGLKLGWLPVIGHVSVAEDFGRALVFVVLPIATLTLIETGVITRMARASTTRGASLA